MILIPSHSTTRRRGGFTCFIDAPVATWEEEVETYIEGCICGKTYDDLIDTTLGFGGLGYITLSREISNACNADSYCRSNGDTECEHVYDKIKDHKDTATFAVVL